MPKYKARDWVARKTTEGGGWSVTTGNMLAGEMSDAETYPWALSKEEAEELLAKHLNESVTIV